MKLIVSIAVMDAVDKRGWKLSDPVLLRKQDLSLYMQPISKLVGQAGYRTTVGDLIRRAIVDSDSAAVAIVVFIADSHVDPTARATLMANISQALCQHYRPN